MATEKQDAQKEPTDSYMVKTPVKMGGVVHQDGDLLELTEKQAQSLASYGAIYTAEDDDDEEVEEHDPETGGTKIVRKKKSAAKSRARR